MVSLTKSALYAQTNKCKRRADMLCHDPSFAVDQAGPASKLTLCYCWLLHRRVGGSPSFERAPCCGRRLVWYVSSSFKVGGLKAADGNLSSSSFVTGAWCCRWGGVSGKRKASVVVAVWAGCGNGPKVVLAGNYALLLPTYPLSLRRN